MTATRKPMARSSRRKEDEGEKIRVGLSLPPDEHDQLLLMASTLGIAKANLGRMLVMAGIRCLEGKAFNVVVLHDDRIPACVPDRTPLQLVNQRTPDLLQA